MKIKIEKLKELPDAVHPNNIEVGYVKIGSMFREPTVGERFRVGLSWSTSVVQEIIDAHTFRTRNSIYRWSVVPE